MEAKFHAQFYQTQPEVTLVDLARFVQGPGERVKDYIACFKIAKQRCRTFLLEDQFVKLCINGLEFKLKKKFKGGGFHDFFDLTSKASMEEADRKQGNRGHIHVVFNEHDEDLEVGMTKIIADKPMSLPAACSGLVKFRPGHKHPSAEETRN
ncbi:hypothetical protein CRG98_001809 [Punica granatum]|uniref:Retrotransposon gag domain-containing protein n=1 Tax=Punica granatum TaxID=22663 RepID=A0A2I0LAY3_PUNGR|nr:hypothetical protein CRG98_001809 [Punica granatum]